MLRDGFFFDIQFCIPSPFWIQVTFQIVYDCFSFPLFLQGTDFLEFATASKNLGAEWLLEKLRNFMP